MIVRPIEKKPLHRCEVMIHHSGNGYFPRPKKHCMRLAVFSVDGVCTCKQHAGDAALQYVLSKQGEL